MQWPDRQTPSLPRRVLVLLGHPRGRRSLNGALAEAYAEGAREAGWSVAWIDLSEMTFDPDVCEVSPRAQPLEPDLERLRSEITYAKHIALVYPTWWGVTPARMKGALDRVLLPGWAFRQIEGGSGYEGLLGGRTAEILTTMDTPAFVYRWIYGAPGSRAMARATLGFCGVEVTRITRFGPVAPADCARIGRWIGQAHALGTRLRHGPRSVYGRAMAVLAPWVTATRLQFHPMAFLAYLVGALVAADGIPLNPISFWLGYAAAFLLEAAAVFVNDIGDFESDRRNRFWGPMTGGSRVLVTGALTHAALKRGAALALLLSLMTAGALLIQPGVTAGAVVAVYGALLVLAIGYTAPPLKLCHRGLGELDVALTHSFGVLMLGAVAQGAGVAASGPLLLAIPLALAVLPAIILSGVPDRDADLAAGKRTLVVRLGTRRALGLAAVSAVAAAAAAVALRHLGGIEALAGIEIGASLNAIFLAGMIVRETRRGDRARRIDGLLAGALGYILWFCVVPLLNLL